LDLSMPPEAGTADRHGIARFASRYGFIDKPVRIRFRALDPRIALLPGPRLPDITLGAASFASLEVPVRMMRLLIHSE